MQDQVKPSSQDSIELGEILQSILGKRRILLTGAGVGFFLGILIAFSTPKEYMSSSYILLESDAGSSSLGQFGTLAGLAGINMNQLQNGQNALTPEIFPDIIQSRDFLAELAQLEYSFATRDHERMSLGDYYFEVKPGNIVKKTLDFILSIPARLVALVDKPSPAVVSEELNAPSDSVPGYVALSSAELFAIRELGKRIEIEQKDKMIRLNVTMPEPIISAEVNAIVLQNLMEYVTEYKVGKQRKNLDFVEQRVVEAYDKFAQAQMELAAFRDRNQGIISQRMRTKEEQLLFEFNIASNVYNSLKQEYEQASIQLKKETPAFTMLEKPAVPLGPSRPNKPLILIFSLFMGLFCAALYVVYGEVKSRISNIL